MTILKGIPTILSPHLLQILAEMGHGDYIVLADANFPSSSIGFNCPGGVIRMDGHDIPTILKAILTLLPLDTYVTYPVYIIQMYYSIQVGIMSRVESDKDLPVLVRDVYQKLIDESEKRHIEMEHIERFAFYEKAKSAYCVIATSETAMYGNIILQKGVIADPCV